MRPVAALIAALHEVLLFGNALRSLSQDPGSKFPATIFYFAEFDILNSHANLDAGPRPPFLFPHRRFRRALS